MFSRAALSASRLAATRSTPTTSALFPQIRAINRTFARNMAKFALTAAIKDDHEEMYEYYDNYQKATDADTKERWARQLIWEVARHAVGEEIVVYPLMEKYLGQEGKDLADEDRAQHLFVKEKLYELEGLKPGTEQHDHTMKLVIEHLKPHNDSEEQKDLPALEAKISAEESEQAALSFKRTKKFVPTRAHPAIPPVPPSLETFLGFLQAPIDHLKDAFAKFPTDEMKKES